MPINGIGMNGMSPSFGGATKTTKTGDEVQFSQNVMKCVAIGDKKAMLQSIRQGVLQHNRLHRLTMEKQLVLQQQGIQDC